MVTGAVAQEKLIASNPVTFVKTAYMTVKQDIGSIRSISLIKPELQMMDLTFGYSFNNSKRSATLTDVGSR